MVGVEMEVLEKSKVTNEYGVSDIKGIKSSRER